MTAVPKISCICITSKRPGLLKRAIQCFKTQNYPDKELIISYPEDDNQSPAVISDILKNQELEIIQIQRPEEESVGNARNNAIRKCTGTYVCMWDDDDWYHSSRLSLQFNSMQESGQHFQASVLSRILLYNEKTRKAYYSFSYTWDGTILCRKEILLQNAYADRNSGEDTHIITFLSGRKLLYQIEDFPFLYVYIYHGGNTWNYKHFEYFINKSEQLDEATTHTIQKLILDE